MFQSIRLWGSGGTMPEGMLSAIGRILIAVCFDFFHDESGLLGR